MKIARVTATPVEVPRLARLLPKTAHGEVLASRYVVLQIQSTSGTVGIGEVTCSPAWNGEEALETTRLVGGLLGPELVGADPLSWADVSTRFDGNVHDRPFLRAAVEMACLDLAARHLGVPAYVLLGGAYRTSIATKIVLPAREIETVRTMASRLVGLGITTVKVKVGLDVDEDIARVAAVRKVIGPDVKITVDANEGWSPSQATPAIERLDAFGVVAVEQPLPRHAWEASAALRRTTRMAVMGDESIWTRDDVLKAASTGAFDTVNLYPGKCGGIRRTLALADLAQGLGLAVSYGSNLELGIGAAALAHAAAATRRLSPLIPADLIGPLYFESAMVEHAGFVGWDRAEVPSGAGLGVRLDPAALESYRIRC